MPKYVVSGIFLSGSKDKKCKGIKKFIVKKMLAVEVNRLADDNNEECIGEGSLASDILQWSGFGKMTITMRKVDEDFI